MKIGPGVSLIMEERCRQLTEKNWNAAHDDEHIHDEMAMAAAELAALGTDLKLDYSNMAWQDGWGLCRKHSNGRLRQLVIAGALIAAEIDRLVRLDLRHVETPAPPTEEQDA